MATKKSKAKPKDWRTAVAKGAWKLGKSSAKASGKVTAKAARASGKLVWGNRKEIGGTLHGAAEGTYRVARNAQAQVRFKERIRKKRAQLEKQAKIQRAIADRFRRCTKSTQDRHTILDSIAVGGNTLYAYSTRDAIPENILKAYESAFPDLSQNRSFQEAIDSIPSGNLVGFASVLKGKLFELQYVEWLNSDHLPDGYHASIAESPTNPDWDIKVVGPDGQVSQLIQAKASESVYYVEEALRQNPHIDVVAPTEVASQLMAQGVADNVIDSGMSIDQINGDVFSAINSGAINMDWAPPAVAVALIAFSSYREKDLGAYEKARNFGSRSAQAYLVYLLGGAVAVGTGTFWLGALGALGARIFLGSGSSKADQLSQLSQAIRANNRAQKRTWAILTS